MSNTEKGFALQHGTSAERAARMEALGCAEAAQVLLALPIKDQAVILSEVMNILTLTSTLT